MPRKTSAKSADTSTDGIAKPKRRTTKKKSASEDIVSEAVAADLVSEETSTAPVETAKAAEPDFAPEPIPETSESVDSSVSNNVVGSTGAMSDIMPKAPAANPYEEMAPPVIADLPASKPVSSPADTSFLKSDDYSFGLKEKKSSSNWVTKTAYVLGTLIVLMLVVLGAITYFNNRNLNVTDNTGNQEQTETPTDNTPAATVFKYTISGPASEYIQKVQSAIGTKISDLAFDSTTTNSLPALTEDTILFKTAAVDKANALQQQLASLGIKAKLQEKSDITTDIAVYLTPTVSAADLSGNTSSVYNASGKTGAAKALCDVLTKYKVNSCTAVNFSGTPPTGLQLYSANQNLYFMLKRTAEFKNATFNTSQSGQVEDIRVVIGK